MYCIIFCVILCNIEVFCLHYTGPIGTAVFYGAAAPRAHPHVPPAPCAPPVPGHGCGCGHGGREQARGGRFETYCNFEIKNVFIDTTVRNLKGQLSYVSTTL
ncbi:PREDICTED: uncharacterized protein LOC107328725 [Acropora digitifera]|uniref:uncharacterized protein LOC107328725 n=1 Tax=Acropora digitifera TaxID=70779 RepID=UPI00077AC795|nr:PREDICTED: uncharacterized protein LOC107328725 [Acropora digitifera]